MSQTSSAKKGRCCMRVLYAFAAIVALFIAVAVTCAGPKHESTASVEIGRDLCGTPSAGVFEITVGGRQRLPGSPYVH